MDLFKDIYNSYLIPSWDGVHSWIIESVSFFGAFLESLSFEQSMALFFCFVLLIVTRNILFIKRNLKKTLDSDDKIRGFIEEIKYSENRINESIKNLKQSHKSKFENIMDYIPAYPVQIDRTGEVLDSLDKFYGEAEDRFKGLVKRNKDEIKLLELLRRELQEVREDNTSSIQHELSNLPEIMEEIKGEQYKRFNRLDKQIDSIDVSPQVNIPLQPDIVFPIPKDYSEEISNLNRMISDMGKGISHFQQDLNNTNDISHYKNIEHTIELLLNGKDEFISERLKLTENKIIDAMPIPTILREAKDNSQEFNFPDFKKLNRELLIQIEEAVSARLDELNKSILQSRELSSNEIENTISQIDKITKVVTSKLLEVKPNGNNNQEVINSIGNLSIELERLKKQVSNISKEVIDNIPEQQKSINIEEIIDPKLKEIERIFNEGTKEIKTEIRNSADNISDLIIKLPLINRDDLSTMDISLNSLHKNMNTIINKISDIDITIKENQDKFNMIFFTHISDLKLFINNLRSETNDINIETIIFELNNKFDKIDHNFDKFLKQLSANTDRNGSPYEINTESLDQIKHIFEVDIINQYQETMIFLEMLGNRINELTTKRNKS
jgi:hypothetical protein